MGETQELTGAKRQHERRREEERSHKTMTTTTRKLARNVVRTVTVSKASPAQLSRGKAVRLISKQRTRTWSTTVRAEGNDNSYIDVEPKELSEADKLRAAERFMVI